MQLYNQSTRTLDKKKLCICHLYSKGWTLNFKLWAQGELLSHPVALVAPVL